MPRPATNRSRNATKLTVPQLPEQPAAFARLLESRNASASSKLYARDLHEEALTELLQDLQEGHDIRFVATPAAGYSWTSLSIDRALKERALAAAARHNVRIGTLVLTAFIKYLERHRLPEAA